MTAFRCLQFIGGSNDVRHARPFALAFQDPRVSCSGGGPASTRELHARQRRNGAGRIVGSGSISVGVSISVESGSPEAAGDGLCEASERGVA